MFDLSKIHFLLKVNDHYVNHCKQKFKYVFRMIYTGVTLGH